MRTLAYASAIAALLSPSLAPALAASVCSGAAATTARPDARTCRQAKDCRPASPADPWSSGGSFTGRVNFVLNGTSTTSPTNYPVIRDSYAGGLVGPRNSTLLQIVGAPNIPGDAEVNAVDAFAYNGTLEYDAERWDRGKGNGAVRHGEGIGAYTFEPFDGLSDSNTAGIVAVATENQVHGSHNGTDLIFEYTPNASGGNLRYVGLAISPGGLGGVTIGDKGHQAVPADLGKGTLNVVSDVATGGHLRSNGSKPTLTGCPSGATITGTDNAGWVYFGGGGARCQVNFAKDWASTPVCLVQNYGNTSPVAYVDGLGRGQFVIRQSGTFTGKALYICQGAS